MIEHMKMMQMPYLHIWSMLLPGQVTHRTNSSCFGVGYSRRKNQTGRRGGVGWGHSFFKKDLELLWFFSLLLKVWGKTKLHSWKFGKIMNVTSLENFKTKKKSLKSSTPGNLVKLCTLHPSEISRPKPKTPGNFTWIFLGHIFLVSFPEINFLFPFADVHGNLKNRLKNARNGCEVVRFDNQKDFNQLFAKSF